ncbi:hypothetical protein CDAR_68731 [Caerostris darwini]|uniref:Uncharacterized protein n=1 Tax=Caerostris darwini TaxID=1538125 RepID=A0AAV4WY54_9ARAC|nr:hypothetical protein CDAR_68731 [Caerostris darwini]
MQHLFPPSGALLPTDKTTFSKTCPPLRNRTILKWWKDIPRHDYGLYNEKPLSLGLLAKFIETGRVASVLEHQMHGRNWLTVQFTWWGGGWNDKVLMSAFHP